MPGNDVVASGEVSPANRVGMSFTLTGPVQEMAVSEGDAVQPGDVLVTLDLAALEAGATQAEADLAAAHARQALLQAPPRPEEVAVAEAQLRAAEARLAQATAERDRLLAGVTEADVAAARAELAIAQAEERSALHTYDQMQARKAQDWEDEVTALRLRAAELACAAAEAQVTQVEQSVQVQVREATATVQEAQAQRDAAQARLDLLWAGPTAQELAAAEAAVAQAEARRDAARAALDQASLQAPFAGTVATLAVNPSETVLPGQEVLVLADLDHLQVETTDLSERDVSQVAVGQLAIVSVEPLGVQVGGHVAAVAAQATTAGGDVVYQVIVELDEQPPGLRWGMTVEVKIATE
jgi:HlyD family secretion protein